MAWQMYVLQLGRVPYPVFGAFAATGLRGAEVLGSRCVNVRRGHGWSCMLLQYDGAPDLPSGSAEPATADGSSSSRSSIVSAGIATAATPCVLYLTDTTIFNNSISAGGVPGLEVGCGAIVIAGPGPGPLVALDAETAAWAAAAAPDGPVAAYAAAASAAAVALSATIDAQDSDSTGVLEPKQLAAMGAVNTTVDVAARGCVLSRNMGAHGAVLAAVLGANLGTVSLVDSEAASNTAYLSGAWLFAAGSVGALLIGPNATVTANSASTAGGAAYVHGNITGVLRVGGGSRVTTNSVSRYGGFATVNGSVGSLEVAEASAVDANTAGRTYDDGSEVGGKGGVAYVRGGIGAITLAGGSSMSYNVVSPGTPWSSGGGGGALAVQAPVGTLALLDGSAMVNNSASNSGGAVYIYGGLDRLLVSGGSRLSNNNCTDDTGGALAVEEGLLRSAVVEGGSAVDGNSGWQGGALWAGGPMQELVVAGRSSMSGNRAAATSGGAALVSGDIVAVRVEGGSRMCGNSAGTSGGALRARRIQALSVIDSELSSNTALGRVAPAVVGWSFSGSGGGVYASGGVHDLTLLRSNVSYNRGVSGAGGFLFQGAENAVETGAAGLPAGSIDASPGVHWVEGSRVVGNEVGLGGGALWYARLPLQLVVTGGSRVAGNVARGGSGGAIWAGWEPGAMDQPRRTELTSDTPLCRQGARITVNGSSTLTANRAAMDGAAICVSLDIFAAYGNCTKTGNSSLTLELYGGATFDSNNAAGGGGAVFVLQPYNFQVARLDVRINASRVRFLNNSAGADAIGLLRGSSLGPGDGSSSLAASAVGGSRRVSAFSGHGGAVLVWSERRGRLGVELSGNRGMGGSGGALLLGACPAAIGGSSMLKNSAGVSGGAVALWDQTLESIAPNTSGSSSGSSNWQQPSQLLPLPQQVLLPVLAMNNCTLDGNTASGKDGGAAMFLDLAGAGHSAVLRNCSLAGNRALLGPGGAVAAVLRGVALDSLDSLDSLGGALTAAAPRATAAVAALDVRGCVLGRNLAGDVGGGALFVRRYGGGSGVWVTESSMVANVAAAASNVGSGSSGGALLFDGRRLGGGSGSSGSSSNSSDGWALARVQSCELTQNQAAAGGALAAFLDSDAAAATTSASAVPPTALLTLRDSVLSDNAAVGDEAAQAQTQTQTAGSSPEAAGLHFGGCGGAVLVQIRSAAAAALVLGIGGGVSGGGLITSSANASADDALLAAAAAAAWSDAAAAALAPARTPPVFIMQGCHVASNRAAAWGGAVFVPPGSAAAILNSTFASNAAGDAGGALAGFMCSSLLVRDSDVSGGRAGRAGGGLAAAACAAVTAERTHFSRNAAGGGDVVAAGGAAEAGVGGAVWVAGVATTQLLGCRIEGNAAQEAASAAASGAAAGGGVCAAAVAAAAGASPQTLVVADSTIGANTASRGGGLSLGTGLRALLLRSQVLGNAAVVDATTSTSTSTSSSSDSSSSSSGSGSSSLAAADAAGPAAATTGSLYAGHGGGMFVEQGAAVLVSGCSFWRPAAAAAAGTDGVNAGAGSNAAAAGAAIATLQSSRGSDGGGALALGRSRAQSLVTALWTEDASLSAIYARCGNATATNPGGAAAAGLAGNATSGASSARDSALTDLSGCVAWASDERASGSGGGAAGSEEQQQLQLDGAARSAAAILLPPSHLRLVEICTVDERSGQQQRCVSSAAARAPYSAQQQQPALAAVADELQLLEVQPERPFTLRVQLFDDLGQPWTADWPPVHVGLAIIPVPPSGTSPEPAHGNSTGASGTPLTPAAQLAAACAAAAAAATAAAGGVNAAGTPGTPPPLWCEAKAVSLATLDGSSAVTAGAELLVDVGSGAAGWPWLLVRGWPGRYVLAINTHGSYAVAPLALPLQLRRCAAGQTLDTSAAAAAAALQLDLMAAPTWTACRSCDMFQVGLWTDDRPELAALGGADQLAAVTAAHQTASACLNCPAHAVCPTGPVLLPAPGYWHSAPNSPLLLRCPNADACTYDDGSGLGDAGGGANGTAAAAARRRLLQLGAAATGGSSNGSSSNGAWDVAGEVARMGFNDSRSLRLALCQQLWYSTNPPGQAPALLQLLQPAAPPPPPSPPQPPSPPSSAASSPTQQPQQPLSQAQLQDQAQARQACVLWGLAPGDARSYMAAQCAPGYGGHLCATCEPRFALSLDFQCSPCPTTAQTVGLGLLAFAGSVALVLYTAYTNSGEPSDDDEDGATGSGSASGRSGGGRGGGSSGGGRPETGDIIKASGMWLRPLAVVVVVHMQMFIIITRLPIDYPNAVLKFRGALNAITGTASYVAFSPSCLAPDQSPAGQARAGLLGALAVPLLVAVVALGLWALRYHFFSQARMRRSTALPRWRTSEASGSSSSTSTPRHHAHGGSGGGHPQHGPQGPQGSGRQRTSSGLLPSRFSLGRWWLGGGGGSNTPFNFSFRSAQADDEDDQGGGDQAHDHDEEYGKEYGRSGTGGGGAAGDAEGSGGRDTAGSGGDTGPPAGRGQQQQQQKQLQSKLLSQGLPRDGDSSLRRDEGSGEAEQQQQHRALIAAPADAAPLLDAGAAGPAAADPRPRHRVSWAGGGNPSDFASQAHATAAAGGGGGGGGGGAALDAKASAAAWHLASRSGAAGSGHGSSPPPLPSATSAPIQDTFPTRPSPGMRASLPPRSRSGRAGSASATAGAAGAVGAPPAHGSNSGSSSTAGVNPILRSALRSASASREAGAAAGATPPVTPPAVHSPAAGSPQPRSSPGSSVTSTATGGGSASASANGSPSTRPLLPPGPGSPPSSSGDRPRVPVGSVGPGVDRSSAGGGAAGSPHHPAPDEAGGGAGPPGTQRSSWASGWSSHKSILRASAGSQPGVGQPVGSGASSSPPSSALRVPLASSSPSSSPAHRMTTTTTTTPAASRQQSYARHGSRGSAASGASGGLAHRHSGRPGGAAGAGTGGGSGVGSGRYGDGRSSGGSQPRHSPGHLSAFSSRLLRSVSTAVRRLPVVPLVKQLGSLRSVGSHLQHYDQALSLPRQLGVVLLAGIFVLYPGLVSASLSVFACRTLDTAGAEYGGEYDSNLAATWHYGYWIRDMGQECYAGTHATLYVPLGVVAVLLFCVGPPAASFAIVWRVRNRLNDHHTRRTYGFLYSRYRPSMWWWESVLQLETLSLVAVDVFARALTVLQQALLLLAVLTLILTANMLASPLRHRLLVALEFVSLAALSLTITLSLYFTDGDTLSPAAATAVGVIILVINVGMIVLFVGVVMRRHQPQLSSQLAKWGQGLAVATARCCGGRSCCDRLLPAAWRPLPLPGQPEEQHAPPQQKMASGRLEGVDEADEEDEQDDQIQKPGAGHGAARGKSDSSSGGPTTSGRFSHGSGGGGGDGVSRLLAAPQAFMDSPEPDPSALAAAGGDLDDSDVEHERKLQALGQLREEEEKEERAQEEEALWTGRGLEEEGRGSLTAAAAGQGPAGDRAATAAPPKVTGLDAGEVAIAIAP
ncbi:hypothetical protein HXX76_005133 [Chlamydomonas incerta]|uniref:Uncharacterized protein n=1 Tax=Chlamydomonas incerta TaxID=51695 RepID=A0A835W5Z3_CHLIN|nr:hypothetical protein HXX76_005133 [Chlamydomonas incerta]|eukprot:KAG2438583.1 hypothetical protein HXX76_005133 [Chlamydomonas incerta]